MVACLHVDVADLDVVSRQDSCCRQMRAVFYVAQKPLHLECITILNHSQHLLFGPSGHFRANYYALLGLYVLYLGVYGLMQQVKVSLMLR